MSQSVGSVLNDSKIFIVIALRAQSTLPNLGKSFVTYLQKHLQLTCEARSYSNWIFRRSVIQSFHNLHTSSSFWVWGDLPKRS